MTEMLVVAYLTSGLTEEQVTDLRAAACAQAEGVDGRPDVDTFDVTVGFTVGTQNELQGVLEVGAGL